MDNMDGMTSRSAAAQRLGDLARLRGVRDRIDREYAQPLDVEALARGAHMSAGHLSREFKAAYGESPYSYLMTRRIERAMALLRRGDLSVTEVCFAVGCSSLGTFSTRFAELAGVPPSTYRRQAAAAAGLQPDPHPGTPLSRPAIAARSAAATRPLRCIPRGDLADRGLIPAAYRPVHTLAGAAPAARVVECAHVPACCRPSGAGWPRL